LDPKECTLDRPEAIKALQFLADLRFKYGYAPRPEVLNEMKANEMVQNGRLAMSIGGGWGFNAWEPYKFKWDIGHFPKGPAKRDNYTFYYPLSIPKASKVPDGAWELLKYYEDVAIKQIIVEGGLQGTRISDMEKLFAANPKPPESREVLVDSVQNFGYLDPRLTNWEEVWRAIQTELDYLWIGERQADVCARNAKKAADALIPAGKM
jgi:multiple sugar transport system substrate-binding protein